MPAGESGRLLEELGGRDEPAPQVIDASVVEPDEGQVQLADDDVDIVARVADQGPPLLVAGKVGRFVRRNGVGAHEELGGVLLVEQVGAVEGPPAVDGIEVEAGRAVVHQGVGVVAPLEPRGRVERQVVVDELAHVGVPGGEVGVVAGEDGDR